VGRDWNGAGVILFTVIGLGVLLVITIIVSFQLGRYPIPAKEVLGNFAVKNLSHRAILDGSHGNGSAQYTFTPYHSGLPGGLAVCQPRDGLIKVFFQNPMAAPDILGASAGAAFGAALAILNYGSSFTITVSAFSFSLLNGIPGLFYQQESKG